MDGTLPGTDGTRRDMTVQMLTTKAEQAILKTFEDNAAHLPGGKSVAELRRAAIGAFASKGLPSRRVEEFKYTDLKANLREAFPLVTGGAAGADTAHGALGSHFGPEFAANAVAFVDGRGVSSGGQAFLADSKAVALEWVQAALADESLAASADLLLNTALFTDGAVIDIQRARMSPIRW